MATGRLVALMVVAAGLAGSGCGDDKKSDPQPSIVSQLCTKADTCNYLPAGTSAQDCTDLTQQCVNALTSSARTDWNNAVGQCLAKQNCQNFADCYAVVPDC
jgi:arginyl-tRNA--protein-N-Asp/Glu arginylyltransferase